MNKFKGGGVAREALVSLLALYMILSTTSSVAQETEEIEEIEVIGITPTRGVGVPEELIPTKVDFFFDQGRSVLKTSEKRSDRGILY